MNLLIAWREVEIWDKQKFVRFFLFFFFASDGKQQNTNSGQKSQVTACLVVRLLLLNRTLNEKMFRSIRSSALLCHRRLEIEFSFLSLGLRRRRSFRQSNLPQISLPRKREQHESCSSIVFGHAKFNLRTTKTKSRETVNKLSIPLFSPFDFDHSTITSIPILIDFRWSRFSFFSVASLTPSNKSLCHFILLMSMAFSNDQAIEIFAEILVRQIIKEFCRDFVICIRIEDCWRSNCSFSLSASVFFVQKRAEIFDKSAIWI